MTTEAGILIPVAGVAPDTKLTISSNAYDGSVNNQAVLFPEIGSLGRGLNINFKPVAGEIPQITFDFELSSDTRIGNFDTFKAY